MIIICKEIWKFIYNYMKNRKIKVAIVDNSINSSIYTPVKHWNSFFNEEWESFKAKEKQFPDLKSGEYTHLILTGSESSILEKEKWVYEEIELIKEAVEKDLHILGSCWGHQLLAVALAGPLYVRRCTNPEIGWIKIFIKEANSILGEGKQAYAFSSHFDEVINLSNDFVVLASSEYCQIQAFQVKDRPIWGIQFHPEMNISNVQDYLKGCISMKFKTSRFFEKALASVPKDSGLIYKIIERFFCKE